MRYPVVLFDAGETLIGPRESFGATYAAVLSNLGLELPAATLDRAMREAWIEISESIPAGTDRYRHFPDGEAGYWLRLARRTIESAGGSQVTNEFAATALQRLRAAFLDRQAWTVYDDVLPTLTQLQHQGVRLGIVSNWDSRLPQVLRLLDLDHHFETITYSHAEGIEKPNPELFHRALTRLNATPDQTLHVGDTEELDIEGANAAGIEALLLQRKPGTKAKASANVIQSLRAIPAFAKHGRPPRPESAFEDS